MLLSCSCPTAFFALPTVCSAILAHVMLNEKLNVFGMLGCLLCITGSLSIVLHAPPERHLGSVVEVWQLAMQPGECGIGGWSKLRGGWSEEGIRSQ